MTTPQGQPSGQGQPNAASEQAVTAGEQVVLCLDTSGPASVALVGSGADGRRVLARGRSEDPRRHAETLTPLIIEALAQAGVGMESVDAVVVGTGPAPYTGLRVGLATAKTLAHARNLPAWGVASLDALALAALANADARTEVLVVSDAKRREVYFGRYTVTGGLLTSVDGPGVAAPAHVATDHADLIAAGAVYGPGLALYPEEFGVDPTELENRTIAVDPALLADLAAARTAAGEALALTPLYLRRPDVQMSQGRKRAS